MNFNYNLPVNLIFGRGRVNEVGQIASTYGSKALIVTGHNSTKNSGLLDRTITYLNNSNMDCVVFNKVSQNPLTTTALEGAEFAINEKCDVIIGLGGGSIMDCAKAIAFICKNDGDINDYILGRLKSDNALPIILIPTTCGTGSEGNGFAVLTNPENGDKKSLRCNAIVASASIIDSECMMTMPKSILAAVGFDALCHCMEAYISRIGQPITDVISLHGIELIGKYLIPLYEGSDDPEAWDAISLASTFGGMAINTAGVTLPHGMEHPASGLRNIVHGKGLVALVPVVFEESIKGCPKKFAEISRRLGGKDENDCVEKIKELIDKLDLNTTLSKQGIKEEDVDWMVENCFKVSSAGINYHPVAFNHEDIKRLYLKAL
ncbi:MAG TPA: alcohol dehydrogenase [Lachnospiraceae bacterium]|nr:alcohol dehydrogenase [Lachnospiraceae bacterium]